MNSFSGILGAIDIIAAMLIVIYLSNLGSWIWILVLALLWQGFSNLMGLFK